VSESVFASLRKRLFDRDYSPAYQDEYQRLWHEAAAERDKLKRQLERLGWKRHMVEDE
jgi:hypothetical protein